MGSCKSTKASPEFGLPLIEGRRAVSIVELRESGKCCCQDTGTTHDELTGAGGAKFDTEGPGTQFNVGPMLYGFQTQGNFTGLTQPWVRQDVWILEEGWIKPKCDGLPNTWRLTYIQEAFRNLGNGSTGAGEGLFLAGSKRKQVDSDKKSAVFKLEKGDCELCIYRFRIFVVWWECVGPKSDLAYVEIDKHMSCITCLCPADLVPRALASPGEVQKMATKPYDRQVVWRDYAPDEFGPPVGPKHYDGHYGWWTRCPCTEEPDRDNSPPIDPNPEELPSDPWFTGSVPKNPVTTPGYLRFKVMRGYPPTPQLPEGATIDPPIPEYEGPLHPQVRGGIPGRRAAPYKPDGAPGRDGKDRSQPLTHPELPGAGSLRYYGVSIVGDPSTVGSDERGGDRLRLPSDPATHSDLRPTPAPVAPHGALWRAGTLPRHPRGRRDE